MVDTSELSPDEWSWINERLNACRLLNQALNGATSDTPDVDDLDNCLEAWRLADTDHRMDANDFVNTIGVAFGQLIHEALSLEWVIANDELGTDLALFGETNNILIYPVNSIAKRFSAGEVGFIRPLFDNYVTQIGELRT